MPSIISGVAANIYGQAVTILTQLVSVPILIWCWGLHGFGLWSMLLIIPLFLIVSDFGYSAAAAGMMSKAIAHDDFNDALTSLHTALAVVGGIVVAILSLSGALYILTDTNSFSMPSFAGLSSDDVTLALKMLPFLLAYVGVSLFSGLINAVYRVNGLYPLGVMILETGRLVEQMAVIAAAWYGGGQLLASIAMLCCRILFTTSSGIMMLKRTPWVNLSLSHVSRTRLKQLSVPAISAMFVPIAAIGGVQGITLLVGLYLTPAAVGTFSTVRVLYRTVVQIIGTMTRAIVPEYSILYAKKDILELKKLTLYINLILISGSLVGTIFIFFLGEFFIDAWTGGRVTIPLYVYFVLSAHSFFGCIWNGLSNILTGLNFQQHYIFHLLLWNILSVVLLFSTVKTHGILAAAASLAIIDILSFISVWRVWRKISLH